MYFNIMDYIKIYSLIIISIRVIFILLSTRNKIVKYKKWYKYYDSMKEEEESKCYKKFTTNCIEKGKIYRGVVVYNLLSLILEIFCFINPNFYLISLLNDFRLFINMMLNFYSIGEFSKQTLFFIVKIIFDVYIIINKDIITNFMSNSK